jgi:hypothetical protein
MYFLLKYINTLQKYLVFLLKYINTLQKYRIFLLKHINTVQKNTAYFCLNTSIHCNNIKCIFTYYSKHI